MLPLLRPLLSRSATRLISCPLQYLQTAARLQQLRVLPYASPFLLTPLGVRVSVRSHESSDFHLDTESLADQLVPQHQYKLDAAALAGRHFGEASCREYRESVLEVLPHRWTARGDTRFALAHFRKHRHRGAKAQAAGEGKEGPKASVKGGAHGHAPDKVTRAVGKLVGAAGLGTAAMEHAPHTHAHSLPPNVLIAHLRDGIEAMHLYTGRTVCKLLLPSPDLHVDINSDGARDCVPTSAIRTCRVERATPRGNLRLRRWRASAATPRVGPSASQSPAAHESLTPPASCAPFLLPACRCGRSRQRRGAARGPTPGGVGTRALVLGAPPVAVPLPGLAVNRHCIFRAASF